MASSVLWFLHNTLTNKIFLFYRISTSSSSYVKSDLSSIVSGEITCDGSNQYLLNIETWKTLCIFSKFGGNAKRYATGPIFSITSYGLINLGLNLLFFPNLITFFQVDTFKNTCWPISYRISFLFMWAYDFYLSVATFNLSLIIFIFSSVSCINSGSINFFSLNSVQHNSVIHFLPYKAS